MPIKIHRRGLDSLEIGIFPKDKERYHHFINEIILPKFKGKRSAPIELFGFDLYGNHGPARRSEYPIQLIGKDTIELCMTNTYPQRMAPIQEKLTQPYIWKDAIFRAEAVIRQIEEHVGETQHVVQRADISVHFSEWLVENENFFNRITSTFENLQPAKKGIDVIEWIRLGELDSELPQMLTYSKTKDLLAHPRKPIPKYQIKPKHRWTNVQNLEFAWTRKSLSRFDVRTLREFANAIPDLWHFCTNDFVQIINDGGEIAPEWEKLSKVFTEKNRKLYTRKSKMKQDPNLIHRYELGGKDIRSIMKVDKSRTRDEVLEELKKYI